MDVESGVCSRFRLAGEDVVSELRVEGERLNAFEETRPTDAVSAIVRNPKTGRNEFLEMRWGLVPHWAKDLSIRTKLINARAETLAVKPAFRDAFRDHRCILPISEFYEFDETSRYRVTMREGNTMAVAGIWSARNWEGVPLITCAMVTTAPNELIAKVHDRMPAILRKEDWDAWLDPTFYDPQHLTTLLVPVPAEEMCMEFNGYKKGGRRKAQLDLL